MTNPGPRKRQMICTEVLGKTKIQQYTTTTCGPDQLGAYLRSLECGVSAANQEAKLNRIRREGGNTQRPEAEQTQAINLPPATVNFLANLNHYLLSRHGQSRSKNEAGMICTEVLKWLKFNNTLPQPKDLVESPFLTQENVQILT